MAPPLISILIVEDNPMYAEILQRLLPTLDPDLRFKVKWVDTAEKAKAEIERDVHEVMLLDYKLPGADGIEVLGLVRERPQQSQPAVVMLTGMGNEAIAVQAMKSGAKDYLAKDHLDVPSLTRAITSALERKRLETQVAVTARALREKNEELEADLMMASEVQQALLPQNFPVFPAQAKPAESALEFVTRYRPTGAVGGDFFDVHALSDTVAGVFICDVMGHGVRAALVTAILRALVEDLRPLSGDPGELLTAVSARLLAILKPTRMPMFASAFYMVCDLTAGQLRFATAGHPAPLHLRRAAGVVAPLCGRADCRPGPALGVFEDAVYPTATEALAAGDLVLLYTDGVFEAQDAQHEQFGQERLTETVRQRLQAPGAELCDAVLAAITRFSAGSDFVDDVCLVGMEVKRLGSTNP